MYLYLSVLLSLSWVSVGLCYLLQTICIDYVWCSFPDWIYFPITRTPTFLCSELGGHTFVWRLSCYHLLELSKCIPQDAWIMVISLNKLHLTFWKGRKLVVAKCCEEGSYETTLAPWTHSNQQAAPITVHISIYCKIIYWQTYDSSAYSKLQNFKWLFYATVHSLMMGQWGLKHVGVDILRHHRNYNEVCALLGLHGKNWIIMHRMENIL